MRRLAVVAPVLLVATVLAVWWSSSPARRATPTAEVPRTAPAKEAARAPAEGEAQPTPKLVVRILDAETGDPLPACRVVVTPWDESDRTVAETDDTGEIRIA